MPVELKGNQVRIRVLDPRRFTKFRTQDVGKKGKLQRIAGYSKDGKWKTQSWRLNLKDYHSFAEFNRDVYHLAIPSKKKNEALLIFRKQRM